MIEYIKNIIPRIQKYSKGLDKEEVFVEKTEPWIYVDENSNQHQYIFMRDKRLIMSFNGIVKTGKWELLPTNQLLINRIDDEILLDHIFVEKALLVLKLSGSQDMPFVLIDPQIIPDLNVLAYLNKYEQDKEIKNIPLQEQTYTLNDAGDINGPEFYIGKIIQIRNGNLLNGSYRTTRYSGREFCDIVNNEIRSIYYFIEYIYNQEVVKLKQFDFYYPRKGDKFNEIHSNILPINKYFNIEPRYTNTDDKSRNKISLKIDDKYSIINIKDDLDIALYIVIIFIILIIFYIIYLIN